MNIVETLIKLIINNAFIFVIIGGIIFNVVQRFMAQSKEEEQQRSKRAPMPPVNNPSRRERPRYRPVKEEPKTARMERGCRTISSYDCTSSRSPNFF